MAQANGTQRGQDLERRMLGIVGEQAALAGGSHIIGTFDHVGGGGIVEDPVSHVSQAVGQVELAAVLSILELLTLPVLLEPERPCDKISGKGGVNVGTVDVGLSRLDASNVNANI